jgi:hypothetical protein
MVQARCKGYLIMDSEYTIEDIERMRKYLIKEVQSLSYDFDSKKLLCSLISYMF